ncbi:MAG: DUF1887 family protein [Acidobacteria bacterium]|nr:DUF1887 family protein [Acidobacteriota bacterium]
MTTMIALVGEQPMPILLPALYLKPAETILVATTKTETVAQRLTKLIKASRCINVHPYEITSTVQTLDKELAGKKDIIVNLTGGTKTMAIAAFALVARTKTEFVYFQTEKETVLKRYQFTEQGLSSKARERNLPDLISAADYLNAHLQSFRQEGFSKDETGQLNIGGKFEKCIYDALKKSGFEVLAGVRPEGVGDQIEIDLVIRLGNRVGIAEVKMGDKEGKRPKSGIDQLSTAGSNLGTYTNKFLILANRLPKSLHKLAEEKKVTVIDTLNYLDGQPLSTLDAGRLANIIKEKLTQ